MSKEGNYRQGREWGGGSGMKISYGNVLQN
jgi:hypothetical protein